MKLTIKEAKLRLPIPQLAQRLGIIGEIPERDGKTVRCWFPDRHPNGDRKPSFNIHEGGTRGNCFSCAVKFDGPDLVSMILGIPKEEGISRFVEMAGGEKPVTYSPTKRKSIRFPDDLSEGSESEWQAVAKGRALDVHAVNLAVQMGVLKFGTVCGFSCWIILDESRKIAEARRLDGKHFPEKGTLSERKAHTLAGSLKRWPVGIQTTHKRPELFRKVLVCEGGPDLLAAYHFLHITGNMDALPVSILGRANKTIHSEALPHFKGRIVRIYPHVDKDGGGLEAAKRWGKEIRNAEAEKVDAFDFSQLARRDGKPVSDLNDCVVIQFNDKSELEGLLP